MIRWLENNQIFAIIFTLVIAIEIFLFSSIPGTKITIRGLDLSSFYHLVVFFLLNFFLLISLNGKNKIRINFLFIAIIISIIYSILDEIHQIFVPFRSPNMGDILIDITGIFIATLTYIYYKNKDIYN